MSKSTNSFEQGFTFAYGTFQSYYELTYLTNISGSAISWIGTVSSFLLIVIGVFSGSLFDLGYFKSMLCIGAFLGLLGIFTLSLSTQYYQIFLTQGICMGLGSGFLYMPGLALVGRSFTKHRSIALGIVSCGAPLGMFKLRFWLHSLISPRWNHLHSHFRQSYFAHVLWMVCTHYGFSYACIISNSLPSLALGHGQHW